MPIELPLAASDVHFSASALASTADAPSIEPPKKRIKLEADIPAEQELVTLIDASIVIELPNVSTTLAALDGLKLENLHCAKKSKRSNANLFVGRTKATAESTPFLTFKQYANDVAHQALLHWFSMAPKSAILRSIRQVYEYVDHTHYFQIYGARLLFIVKLRVSPLLHWSNSSVTLARNRMFSFFVDLMFPDPDRDAPTVAGFYKVLRPPPNAPSATSYESPKIHTRLMQYQVNAVHWMQQRERGQGESIRLWLSYPGADRPTIFMQKSLGLVTSSEADIEPKHPVPGGLLADEMGLGKSLAIIALAVHNPRKGQENEDYKIDLFTGNTVKPVAATLVVTPTSILKQWLQEVHKHSSLRVCHYRGMAKQGEAELNVEDYDIIVTSYTTLASELYHAMPVASERILRSPSTEKRKCPLVLHEWHRVVMDEAQMIASGTSSAAQVACQIPRKHAWIVTGTPISKTCSDTFGLLHFLRLDPVYANPLLYNKMISSNTAADTVARLFGPLSCRNTKALVSTEMAIPKQITFLCPVELTAIEMSNFNDLLDAALDALDIPAEWNHEPDHVWKARLKDRHIAEMRSWIIRLRQACTHPQIGIKNKTSFLVNVRPLQTLGDVLSGMIESSVRTLESESRARAAAVLQQGQIKEYEKDHQAALSIWDELLPSLLQEVQKASDRVKLEHKVLDANESDETSERVMKAAATDLRYWRELLQRCYFFIGSAHFVLKNEKEEIEAYANAKQIRKELLRESETDALVLIREVSARAIDQDFAVIPEMRYSDFTGGFSSRLLLERLETVTETLNKQANLMDEWREACIQRLVTNLADQNEEASGEEYDESLEKQAEASDYHDLLRIATADRQALVNGIANNMIENDAKALGNAPDASEIIKQGLAARNALIPRGGYQQWDSLVTVLNSFKAKVRQLEYTVDTQGTAAKLELKVARKAMFQLQKQTTPQVKCCEALNSELELVVETLNARLLYYKQLQSISDGLTAFTVIKGAKDDAQMEEDLNRALGRGKEYELEESDISDEERAFRINAATMRLAEDVKQREISINKTRTRISYLTYLGSAKGKEKETCTICISDFDRGAMTICGHIFCRDCFKEWFRQHRACPLCKKVLDRNSFHSITLKQLSSFTKTGDLRETTIASPLTNDHHQSLTSEQLCAIDSVKLVHSYSSKIDTIVKHIMSLPKQAKTILYSNWIEVLTFFARALEENGIMSSLLGQKPKKGQHEGLDAFMQNPDCQVLLMSGKSQSAGLTLVNASSLFLVEPLLNHAVERQIVSRIHRIGQTQETSVFQYAVEGTMEMTILKENARLHRAVADKPVYQEEGESDLNILGSKQYAGRLRAGELTDEDETIALFRSNLVLQSASDRGAQETLVGRI